MFFFDYLILVFEYKKKFKKNKNKFKLTQQLINDYETLMTKKIE